MKLFIRRLILFVSISVVLVWQPMQTDVVQAQGFNIFDTKKNKNSPPKKIQRNVDSERVRKMTQSFQKELNPDQGAVLWDFFFYGIFFVLFVCIVVGLIYWEMLQQKRKLRELDDPMVLVQELYNAHQLSADEKKVIQTVSTEESLPTPLLLFVEPKYLLTATDKSTFSGSLPVLRSLLSKLFDIEIGSTSVTEIMAQNESGMRTRVVEPRV